MALSALHTLAEHYRLRGDFAQMEQMARRQIEITPFQESAHRQVMAALIGQEEQAAALAHYKQLGQMLADELGAAPEQKTSALCTQIQTGQFDRLAQSTHDEWSVTAFDGRQPRLACVATDGQNPDAHFLVLVCPIDAGDLWLALPAATQSDDLVQERPGLVLLAEAASVEGAVTVVFDTLFLSPRLIATPALGDEQWEHAS